MAKKEPKDPKTIHASKSFGSFVGGIGVIWVFEAAGMAKQLEIMAIQLQNIPY